MHDKGPAECGLPTHPSDNKIILLRLSKVPTDASRKITRTFCDELRRRLLAALLLVLGLKLHIHAQSRCTPSTQRAVLPSPPGTQCGLATSRITRCVRRCRARAFRRRVDPRDARSHACQALQRNQASRDMCSGQLRCWVCVTLRCRYSASRWDAVAAREVDLHQ